MLQMRMPVLFDAGAAAEVAAQIHVSETEDVLVAEAAVLLAALALVVALVPALLGSLVVHLSGCRVPAQSGVASLGVVCCITAAPARPTLMH
jgi:hypothetical protein